MRYMSQHNNHTSAGFTLIEMLVIAPIVLLVIGGFIALMVSMIGDILATRDYNTMVYNTQDSLNRIEQDVRLSALFLNTTGTTSPQQGTDNNYSGTAAFTITSNNNMLLLSIPATDKNPVDSSRQIINYANQPNPCGATQTANKLLMTKVAYFVNNGSLWRRTILPPYDTNATPDNNTVCGVPWQQNSCVTGYVNDGHCQTNDVELAKNVQSLTVQYFADPASTVDTGVAGAATATTLSATLTSLSTTAGRNATLSQSIRATKLNSQSAVNGSTPAVPLTVTQQPNNLSVLSGDLNITIPAQSSVASASVLWQRSTDSGATWQDMPGQTSATLLLPSIDLSWNNNQFRAIFTNGSDSVTTSTATLTVGTITWAALNQMTGVGDWDNDGNNDIAGYTRSNGNVYLYRGKGDGTFYGPTLMGTIGTTVVSFAGMGNAMSNGKSSLWWDVSSATSSNQVPYIVASDGGTKFAGAPVLASTGGGWGNDTIGTYAPLLFSSTGNKNRLINRTSASGDDLFAYAFTGTSAPFLTSAPTSYGGGWHGIFPGDATFGAGDWNQDGKGDIFGRTSDGRLCLYTGDGNGGFLGGGSCSQAIDFNWNVYNKVIGAWDYNGDGAPDLIGRLTSNNSLKFFYNTKTGIAAPSGGTTIPQP